MVHRENERQPQPPAPFGVPQWLATFILVILVSIPEILRFIEFRTEQEESLLHPPQDPIATSYSRYPPTIAPDVHASSTKNIHPDHDDDRPSIKELFRKFGSDKGSRHHYDQYYKRWLAPYRDKQGAMILEIGGDGGSSLKCWEQYFSNPKRIAGFTYGEFLKPGAEDKTLSHVQWIRGAGNDLNKETLDEVAQQGPWDIIFDDGTHNPADVIFTLWNLWSSLKPGGLYIVEDLETSYFRAGSSFLNYVLQGGINVGPETNAMNKLKQFVEILQRFHMGAPDLSIMPGDDWLCSMEIGMNLVALHKCSQEEMDGSPKGITAFSPEAREEIDKWLANAKASNPKG